MDDEDNDNIEGNMLSVATREEIDPCQATPGPVGTIPVHFFQPSIFVSRERPTMAADFPSLVDDKPSANGVSAVTDGFSQLVAEGDGPCTVPVLTTPEQRRNFFLGLINELVEECTICIVFLVHRREKRNHCARAKGSKQEETLIDEPGYDVFGNRLTRGSLSRAYQLSKIECTCPVCHRPKCALRFAPHLEKCMGLGRDSRRRAVADISASKADNEVCGSYGNVSDIDEQKSSGEKDEEWLPSQGRLRKRKATMKATDRKKNAVQSSRMPKRCQKAASKAVAWNSTRAKRKSMGSRRSVAACVEPLAIATSSYTTTELKNAYDQPSASPNSESVSVGCSSGSIPPLSEFDGDEPPGKLQFIPEDNSEKGCCSSSGGFPVMLGKKVDDSEQVAPRGDG
ncbi:hypothetical protein M513_10859 [Trichuris suis]|uniref:SAGA-associated factor 11 n=1 Tax=Trichuris suis TaxID=68888 RepID=A0A085LTI6_9BILA|nr:hypothetical protein M513_10859 [Trichuris suis]